MSSSKKKKEKRWLDIYELENLDQKGKKLTKKEMKRLKEFRDKRVKLDKLFTNKCKVCGRAIPKPLEYCSSECRRKEDGKERHTKDETKRAQKTL